MTILAKNYLNGICFIYQSYHKQFILDKNNVRIIYELYKYKLIEIPDEIIYTKDSLNSVQCFAATNTLNLIPFRDTVI